MITSVERLQTSAIPLIPIIPPENFDLFHLSHSITEIYLLFPAHMLAETFFAKLSGEHVGEESTFISVDFEYTRV